MVNSIRLGDNAGNTREYQILTAEDGANYVYFNGVDNLYQQKFHLIIVK